MTPKPTILVAEDDAAIRLVISQTLTADGYAVRATGSTDALHRWIRDGEGDVVVTDVYIGETSIFELMPSMQLERKDLPFIVMSGQNTILTAASAAEHGAFDYLPKPFDIEALSDLVARALKKSRTRPRKLDREIRKAEQDAVLPLIGRSEAMQDVYRFVSRVMNTRLTVIIEGESGTGKELTARAIHTLGHNNNAAFISLEVEGPGREVAQTFDQLDETSEATIYIDEVGKLSPDAQARLVQYLRKPEHARLIVSTQYNLEDLISEGVFRSDLFYRLNMVRFRLPPLRDRAEDIPDLAKAFLIQARELGLPSKHLDSAALDALRPYHWPGNVRELQNLIYRLCALSPDNTIFAKDIEVATRNDFAALHADDSDFDVAMENMLRQYIMPQLMAANPDEPSTIYQSLTEHVERPLITLALSLTAGNKVRAAALLGVNRNTLSAKIRSLGLAEE